MYQVGMIKKRLNKLGRGLFAAKLFMQDIPTDDIAAALGVKPENVRCLLGKAAGMLGLFEKDETKKFSGVMLLTFEKADDRAIVTIAQLDIIIAAKGAKLFTKDPLPKKKGAK